SELDLINARYADAEAAVAGARRALIAARIALTRSAGLSVTDLDEAPLASDPLPETAPAASVEQIPVARLVEEAVRDRAVVPAVPHATAACGLARPTRTRDSKPPPQPHL